MEWLTAIAAFALGWVVCAYRARGGSKSRDELGAAEVDRIDQHRIEAEGRYLECVRRELALWLMKQDPHRFKEALHSARDYDTEMRKADKSRRDADRASLSAKYPNFSDFDLIALKHFVPFDGSMHTELDIVQRYLDISKFLTLLSLKNPYAQIYPVGENDEEVLYRIIQKQAHADLVQEIKTAMGRYDAYCQKATIEERFRFSDRDYEVVSIIEEYTPEICHGVVIKKDGRHGLSSFYVSDNGRVFYSYAATDNMFHKTP